MTAPVVALALFAAVLHASWNALLRAGTDRLWTMTIIGATMGLLALPAALLLPAPPPASWPWLGASALLQVGYSLFLVAAYRHGELGQVYPIVRGSVPILVTLVGYLFLQERLAPGTLLGVLMITGGIMSLALGRGRASGASIGYAFATSLFIAGYSSADAIGVRAAGGAVGYGAWLFVVYGGLLTLAFVALRGRPRVDPRSRQTWAAVAGGALSMIAYGAVLAAFALGPAGPVSALRETSVVFAALIGRAFLGETLTPRRALACVVVAAGAILVGLPG